MDDSRETEHSVAHVWAAEQNGDSHSGGKGAFTIGELSREFGVTLRALRFYENKGLISPQREGLSRLYSQGDRTRLALILKGKKLGFTLGEIRQMIAAEEGRADAKTLALSREKCLEQIELLERQKAEIEEGLNELFRIYSSLSGKLGGDQPQDLRPWVGQRLRHFGTPGTSERVSGACRMFAPMRFESRPWRTFFCKSVFTFT